MRSDSESRVDPNEIRAALHWLMDRIADRLAEQLIAEQRLKENQHKDRPVPAERHCSPPE